MVAEIDTPGLFNTTDSTKSVSKTDPTLHCLQKTTSDKFLQIQINHQFENVLLRELLDTKWEGEDISVPELLEKEFGYREDNGSGVQWEVKNDATRRYLSRRFGLIIVFDHFHSIFEIESYEHNQISTYTSYIPIFKHRTQLDDLTNTFVGFNLTFLNRRTSTLGIFVRLFGF